MQLTRIAIARPVFILMLMVAAIMLGGISYRGLRVEQNPEVTFGVVTVSTVYPGAGPNEVNELVSRRLEDVISGVAGLREVTSTSQEGLSIVVAQFELGTDINQAQNDVRSKVDTIIGDLPDGVIRPTIDKFDSGSEPVMFLNVNSDRLTNRDLRDLADRVLSDRFARLKGVGQVSVSGGEEREIQVRIKRDALLSKGIGVIDVLQALRAATLNAPSGRVVTGQEEYGVRVLGEFTSVDEIREMPIKLRDDRDPNAPGSIIRLGQIADIEDASKERTAYSRLNGREAVLVIIQKTRDGNAVEISDQVKTLIPQLESQYGLKFQVTQNQADIVSESLFDVTFAIVFGIVLVTLIVWVFLHDWRGTLIVAIAIPICIFASFIFVKLFGFTLNNLTMLGLALSVGVLVDDAIVVLENIYRHLRLGEDPEEAALNGRGEIGLAAIAITLADVVVFLPIAFMGGIVGQFYRPLALTFVVAVLLSLFVSFTVTPMLAARWYRKGEDIEEQKGRFGQWFERGFQRFEHAYQRTLRWSLNHRWFVFILGNLALFAVIFFIAGSFSPNFGAAMATGMPLVVVALFVALIAFTVNVIKGWNRPREGLRLVLGAIVIGIVAAVALAGRAPVPPPILAIVVSFLLLGIWALFKNASLKVARTRLLLSGLAFGLIFPAAALIGFGYAQWKGESVFKFAFIPPSDSGNVGIEVEMPPGTPLSQTENVVRRIEEIVAQHPDAKFVTSNLGSQGAGGFGSTTGRGSQFARVSVTLYPKKALLDNLGLHGDEKLRTRADTAVAADLLERIGRIPGANITVSAGDQFGFGRPVQISLTSDNRDLLLATAVTIRERLAKGEVQGVVNPNISSKPGRPELRAIPDRVRLADAGLTVADTAAAMALMYEGNDDTKFRVRGEEYPIRVMMDLADRNNPETIQALPLRFDQGNPIYLTQVARIEQGVNIDKIERRNRLEEIRLDANILPGFAAGSVQAQVNAWMERERLIPAGVQRADLGQADAQAQESGFLFGALILGLVLVYMLLASLYDNLLYPFIIQLAQPQAMVGALLALMITDKALNIIGFIGIIALVGLVGKNAILVVDYANTLRARGLDRISALLEAGPTRLRPIMMTSLALILGMLPVALAIGRGSEFRETIGIIIIGGITLSTFLTLLVIPVSYTIFDDMSRELGQLIYGRQRRLAAAGGPSEPTDGEGPGTPLPAAPEPVDVEFKG